MKESKILKGSLEQNTAFFRQQSLDRATAVKLDDDVMMKEMNTKHENYINCVKVYAKSGSAI